MTHALFAFNGGVEITLHPETDEDRTLLVLAFKDRIVKSFAPGKDGAMVLSLVPKPRATEPPKD